MNKYAVLIGNSQFPDESDKSKLPDLACPEKDVDGLAKVLASERGEFTVFSLKNESNLEVLDKLQDVVNQAQKEDLLLIYYSGHGKPNKAGILHLTTVNTVVNKLESRAISINQVYGILDTAKCRKIVIILDCCYSGAAGQGFKGAVDDQLQQLNNARGTYLVTASTELQVAHESAAEGLSLFTKHLIAGLETGEADKDSDGWVSMNELYDYVQSRVVEENPAQQPTKHVKDERGGLFIIKSGLDLIKPRKERYERLRLLLLEFEKQYDDIDEIKIEALSIAKIQMSQLSTVQLQKDDLLDKLVNHKLTFISFIRSWDRLSSEIINHSTKAEIIFNQRPNLLSDMEVYKEWQIISKFRIKEGLALDTETGLMWLRFAHGQIWQNNTTEEDGTGVKWETAFEVAKTFNKKGGYFIYTDWRLPTVEELETLVDMSNEKNGNYINTDVFPNNIRWFWSASSHPVFESHAWIIDFLSGHRDYNRKYENGAVRLVRGNK